MKIVNRMRLIFGFKVLILSFFCSSANGQPVNEVFQTVAFLQGKGAIEHASIDGVEQEVWLKAPGDKQPHPHRKTTFGTGFFVRKGAQIYLITAEHVAKNLKHEVKVTVHGAGDQPLTYDMKDLAGTDNEPAWYFHSEADVALLPLRPSQEFKGIITVIEPPLLLSSENEFSKYADRILTTVGFPLSLGLSGRFSPITKTSKAASGLLRYNYTRSNKQIETTFLTLEDPSVQGFSGGPVYALSEVRLGTMAFGTGQFACVGLVHGTLQDNTGGKFSAVVPSYFIIQTIENFESRK